MQQVSLPSLKTVYQGLEEAAVDVYGFAVVCAGGASWQAEPQVLESLLLGLESFWFLEKPDGRWSHQEFREELFQAVWKRSQGPVSTPAKIGTDVPLGHDEMAYFQLPQLPRAALYLRTKKRFSYASIALILGSPEALVRSEVEKAREFLLGRRLKAVEWSEEDF